MIAVVLPFWADLPGAGLAARSRRAARRCGDRIDVGPDPGSPKVQRPMARWPGGCLCCGFIGPRDRDDPAGAADRRAVLSRLPGAAVAIRVRPGLGRSGRVPVGRLFAALHARWAEAFVAGLVFSVVWRGVAGGSAMRSSPMESPMRLFFATAGDRRKSVHHLKRHLARRESADASPGEKAASRPCAPRTSCSCCARSHDL